MKVLRLLTILAVSMGLSISAFSQVLWQSAETGMSTAQVKSKFPSAVRPDKIDTYGTQFEQDNNLSREALLEIPDYKVGQTTFKVQFLFKSDALEAVRLGQTGDYPSIYFNNVKKLLKIKYGEPLDLSTDSGSSKNIIWFNKGTTIDLYSSPSSLHVFYDADDKLEANKF